MRKPLTKIPDKLVIEALQIVTNYCNQEASNCSECMLRCYDGVCMFHGEIPDRFTRWRKEHGIDVVNPRRKDKKKK